jgi:hypothetical protein
MLYAVKMRVEANRQFSQARETVKTITNVIGVAWPATREQRESLMADFEHRLRINFDSEEHVDYLDRFQRDIDALGETQPADSWRWGVIEFGANPLVAELRTELLGPFASFDAAFHLGERLDEGLRPADVFLRMFDSKPYGWERGSLLANCVRAAGELVPTVGWYASLRERLLRANMEVPAWVAPRDPSYPPEQLKALIDGLDFQVRQHLAAVDQPPQGSRLAVNLNTCQAVLNGTPHRLANRESAIYIHALLEARGDWMGQPDIEHKYPEFTGARISRIREKIPQPIKELIESSPAKGSRISLERLA